MDRIDEVPEGCESVRTTRPWEGSKMRREPLERPKVTTSVVLESGSVALTCATVFLFFRFFFGDASSSSSTATGSLARSNCAQESAVTCADSTTCSATLCPVVVSCTRSLCLSTERERDAKRCPFGEKEDRAVKEEASSTMGWESAEDDAGRAREGAVRLLFF